MRRNRSFTGGLLVLALLALLLTLLATPQRARADGDPGSDVLLAQHLFFGAEDGVSVQQEVQLDRLLDATARVGAPVRVAIIGRPADLGAWSALWGKPQAYAVKVLGYELSALYSGRLLIVMPSGYGFDWYSHRQQVPAILRELQGLKIGGGSGTDLVDAARQAVLAIEQADGVSAAKLAAAGAAAATGSSPSAGSSGAAGGSPAASASARPGSAGAAGSASGGSHHLPSGIFAVILVAIGVAYIAYRRGWRPRRLPAGWTASAARGLRRPRLRPITVLPTLLLLGVVLVALAVNQSRHPAASQASDLQQNPGLDEGTPLTPKPAPDFRLFDERGNPVSLHQYRGKVVILSFVDSECQTLCPLTTQAMLDAKADLGAASADVQLLGVNANWRSVQIEDVANYTQMHGLRGHWHFLTDTNLHALERVWSAFGVNEKKLINDESSQIDHVAATFVIDPQGRMRKAYTTYSNYTAIPQFGQLLAQEASSLLPSHPAVDSHLSYAAVKGITPAQSVRLPRPGGGSLTLGPGRAHLYLFFDTWNRQTTKIEAYLHELDRYQADARRLGLPELTAIDEGSVEPNPGALPAFLRSLPHPLAYPVAIDESGRVADGYGVQGEPWLVLTNAVGKIVWYREIYTNGWPSLATLEQQVKRSLRSSRTISGSPSLKGSPPVLAALHAQSSQLLGGGLPAIEKRLRELRGHPLVVNIWASWCGPCQQEFGYFKAASLTYGQRIGFLGVDFKDQTGNAAVFLRSHHVYYPSYPVSVDQNTLGGLLPGGVANMPMTLYIGPDGKLVHTQIGPYLSLGALEADLQQYAGGGR